MENKIDYEYHLHEEAGLIPGDINDDGEQEWIGTDKQWKEYYKLSETE